MCSIKVTAASRDLGNGCRGHDTECGSIGGESIRDNNGGSVGIPLNDSSVMNGALSLER
jgi:hypothetical protein